MIWRKCSLALWGRKDKGGYLGREKRSIGGENLFALVGKGGEEEMWCLLLERGCLWLMCSQRLSNDIIVVQSR